jgi:hypothetical protein
MSQSPEEHRVRHRYPPICLCLKLHLDNRSEHCYVDTIVVRFLLNVYLRFSWSLWHGDRKNKFLTFGRVIQPRASQVSFLRTTLLLLICNMGLGSSENESFAGITTPLQTTSSPSHRHFSNCGGAAASYRHSRGSANSNAVFPRAQPRATSNMQPKQGTMPVLTYPRAWNSQFLWLEQFEDTIENRHPMESSKDITSPRWHRELLHHRKKPPATPTSDELP